MDRRIDLAIGLLVIAFGAFVLVTASHIRPTGPVVDPIGPRGFPYMVGIFFLVGGCFGVAKRLSTWRSDAGPLVESDGEPDEAGVPASATQAWSIMAASVLYVITLPIAGYIIGTPLYVAFALNRMQVKSWPTIAATALVYTVLTYILFAHYMGVNLPVGPLTDAFRALKLIR